MILYSVPHCNQRNISITELSWRNSSKKSSPFKPSECSYRPTTVQEIPLHTDPTENPWHPAVRVVLE